MKMPFSVKFDGNEGYKHFKNFMEMQNYCQFPISRNMKNGENYFFPKYGCVIIPFEKSIFYYESIESGLEYNIPDPDESTLLSFLSEGPIMNQGEDGFLDVFTRDSYLVLDKSSFPVKEKIKFPGKDYS